MKYFALSFLITINLLTFIALRVDSKKKLIIGGKAYQAYMKLKKKESK